MKKEKWLMREISRWQAEDIIDAETADVLKKRYEPKKNIGFLIILFSVIGTLFIGMGVILIGANNWWYALPVAIRTFIAFLPLIGSQAILLYVLKKKMDSIAFREGAAILNMAGVFASIAIVDQIFHLPTDFTNYVFICGILSFPSMVIMNAISPIAIYYWTVLNGGAYLWDVPFIGEYWGIVIMLVFYAIGAAYAIYNFRGANGKVIYLSWITLVSSFIAIWLVVFGFECEVSSIMIAYFALLILISDFWEQKELPFEGIGTLGILTILAIFTYQDIWEYAQGYENLFELIFTLGFAISVIGLAVWRFKNRQGSLISATAIILLVIRIICNYAEVDGISFAFIMMLISNIAMFGLGVYYIWMGTKSVDLLSANLGMIVVCTLILMRFFDSEMSLMIRGVAFVVLGIGFLLVNLRLIRIRKRAKEEMLNEEA